MASLEQAALSGALTSNILNQAGHHSDPDGREPDRKQDQDTDYPFRNLVAIDDEDPNDLNDHHHHQSNKPTDHDRFGFLTLNQASHHHSSTSMSRGWSGNTGPKGVLLDFKASHGKSGAILGGDYLSHQSIAYPRQQQHLSISSSHLPNSKRRSITRHLRPSPSSTDSDSDLSDRDQRTTSIRTRSVLYQSTKSTTPLTNRYHSDDYYGRQTSSSPTSASGNNNKPTKVDSRGRKLFGHLREVGIENFIQAVEAEKDDKETVVLVHLYDPALEPCSIINHHLSNLARAYPRTKFLRALASELDFFNDNSSNQSNSRIEIPALSSPLRSFHALNLMDDDPFDDEERIEGRRTRKATDSDILPTLIWYRSGEYVQSLPALEREMPQGGIVRGEKGCKDLQNLLKKNGIINDSDSVSSI